MRKEVVFAVLFGVFMGLVFAFGIFRINNQIKKNQEANINPNTNDDTENSQSNDTKASLTLLKPEDQQVFGDDVVDLTGITTAESYVIATGGTSDDIIKSSDNGTFEMEYEIDPSVNNLVIYSISPNNQRFTKSLNVVYSSEAPDGETSKDGDDKIEDKFEQAQKRSEFYEGTITDITEGGIQIKNGSGEIKQISYSNDSTSFAKIGKTTATISDTDLAIGDYILALGYKDNKGLLEAFRILISQPSTPTSVKVFYGNVVNKNKNDMEITEKNSDNLIIEIDNNSQTYMADSSDYIKSRFANISEGDLVIGTYLTNDDGNIARKIYILKTSEE